MQTAIIGQTQPQTVPPPPSAALLDWGIAGALVLYLGKEAIAFFKQKDEKDDRLTDSLIQDLRGEAQSLVRHNNALLLELRSMAINAAQDRKKLSEAIHEANMLSQTLKRDTAGIYLECRSNRDVLVILDSKIDAIHSRLDADRPGREKGALEISVKPNIIQLDNY